MENKANFDDYIITELQKTSPSPKYLNKSLILSCKEKEELKTVNSIFFIILIIQSLFISLVGILLVSDIFLKLSTIGFGILLFNLSLSIYTLTNNKEGVLI